MPRSWFEGGVIRPSIHTLSWDPPLPLWKHQMDEKAKSSGSCCSQECDAQPTNNTKDNVIRTTQKQVPIWTCLCVWLAALQWVSLYPRIDWVPEGSLSATHHFDSQRTPGLCATRFMMKLIEIINKLPRHQRHLASSSLRSTLLLIILTICSGTLYPRVTAEKQWHTHTCLISKSCGIPKIRKRCLQPAGQGPCV